MKQRNNRSGFLTVGFILATAISLVIVGCRNPLLIEVIEDTVEEVVAPPEISAISPTKDAVDVPINLEAISVTFSKIIEVSDNANRTVNESTFYVAPVLADASLGTPISGTFVVQNKTVTFDPITTLSYDTTYRVTITKDVLDVDGNSLTDLYDWDFTTGLSPDNTAPISPSVNINDGATWSTSRTVSLALSAVDERGLAQMNISNTTSQGSWVTYQESYEWTLPADGTRTVYAWFKDSAGNVSNRAEATINVDTTKPTVVVFIIDGGRSATSATEVSLAVTAQDTEGSSGPAMYRTRLAGNAWPETWEALDSEGAAFIGSVALPGDLSSEDEVAFEAQVQDLAGNMSEVVSNSIIYDLTQPTITVRSPAPDEANAPYDTSVVRVDFNEEMNLSTFTPISFFVEDSAGDPVEGDFEFADTDEVVFGRVSLTGLVLDPLSTYFVTVTGDVADVAGNTLGTDERWSFDTGLANDTTAPTGSMSIFSLDIDHNPLLDRFKVLPNGTFATNYAGLILEVDAVDDYNSVYGMNIWGEGDLPPFEDDPAAGWVAYATSKPWNLGVQERTYNLWYRFQDSRGNKTPDPPGYFSVVLDTSEPSITGVEIINSQADPSLNSYVNDPEGLLELLISANDIGGELLPGSGIYEMRFSNDGTFDPGGNDWIGWSPLYDEWQIDISGDEGERIVYMDIADYLGNAYSEDPSNAGPYEIVLYYDTASPSVSFYSGDPADPFDSGDLIVTNADDVLQNVTVTDNVVETAFGPAGSTIADDITFLWEQASGLGTITFDDDSTYTPLVTASEDGNYVLRLTATDPAGNASSATVTYKKDTVAPDPIGLVTAAEGEYSTTGFPEFSWDAVPGADYYRVQLDSETTTGLEIIDTLQTGFSPSAQLPEDEECTVTVIPFDFAGNFTPRTADNGISVVLTDTTPPVITNDGQLFLKDAALSQITVDYGTDLVPGGDDGTVTELGSGIASVLWQQLYGPGTITFGADDNLTTTVQADAHGFYGIRLTVTDKAGNVGVGGFTVNWDIEGPNAPQVSGIDHTPAIQPTWSWSSGGGGNGYFWYQLIAPDGSTVLQENGDDGTFNGTSMFPESALTPDVDGDDDGNGDDPDGHTYVLRVWERDEAGNWSDSYGSHSIWVDSGYTAPPEVIVDGPLVQTGSTITWNWSSGAEQVGATYRWWVGVLEDPGVDPYDDFTDPGVNSWASDWAYYQPNGTVAETFTFNQIDSYMSDGNDFIFVIAVEEYYNNLADPPASDWTGKYGLAAVRVDRQGPVKPNLSVSVSAGEVITGGDVTSDATPTWSWSRGAGSDGIGRFRYKLDDNTMDVDSTITTGTSYTPATLADGPHALYVQEQDSLGNWGFIQSHEVTVDTIGPATPTIVINNGDFSTNSTTVNLTITAATDAVEMSIYDYNPAGWKPWVDVDDITTVVTDGEATKRVYVKVRDEVQNESAYISDTIILDQTPPTGSVLLNGDDFYTPSLDVYLDLEATDTGGSTTDNLEVQYYHYNSGYNGTYPTTWEPFAAHKFANTDFAPTQAYKYVYVRFRDQAGNVSDWVNDRIYLQIPSPTYTWKGYYTTGVTRVYYNPVTEPTGSYNTSYYTYYMPYYSDPVNRVVNTFNPNADLDPVNGIADGQDSLSLADGRLVQAGSTPTSSTSYDYVTTLPKGELLSFFIRPYNPDSGGYGAFSTTSALGFTSDVTVIYDDDETADIDRAELIKEILTDSTGSIASAISGGWVLGSMPALSVTLLPEDLISTSYAEGNKIYGDPVITTTGTSFSTSSTYDGRVRNIASTLSPLVAMGRYSGQGLLYRITTNFSLWGLTTSGQPPVDIDSGNHMGLTALTTGTSRPNYSSDYVWYSPLAHVNLDGNPTGIFTSGMFSSVTSRTGVYRSGGVNPTGGAIYAGDPNYSSHFPVVRQGRYTMWAFDEPSNTLSRRYLFRDLWLGTNTMGRLFFVNVIDEMHTRTTWD